MFVNMPLRRFADLAPDVNAVRTVSREKIMTWSQSYQTFFFVKQQTLKLNYKNLKNEEIKVW